MPATSLSPAASEDASSGEGRIKRRRITTACTRCRDRRVKCDRTRPACAQCTKARKPCKYVENEDRQVALVNETPASIASSETSTPPLSDTWGSVIEKQVNVIKRANDGKHGLPVWAVAEAEEPSRAQALQTYQYNTGPHFIPIGSLGDGFLVSLSKKLPSREICQSFFDNFVYNIHPVVSICHIPSLRQKYDEFWVNLSPSYAIESLVLMLAVLFTGAANATDHEVDTESSSALLGLYERVFSLLDFISYHTKNIAISIQLLQGYTIMNTFKASHLSPFAAFGFLPQLIRFAQSLRLHADNKTKDPVELEERRRIWWHLLFLDVESTIATGLPPIIYCSGYTTQYPSLLRDHNIPVTTASSPDPDDFSPMMIAMQGHYQWASKMQTWFETLPSKEQVSGFKSMINGLIDLIPDTRQAENEWARTYLKMQIDRAYCMLGLRFWQLDQYKQTGCHSEVVQTARSFLGHWLHLSTLEPSAYLYWFISGLVQPLHAVIILLMHLSACVNISEEEVLSRNLIEKVMRLRVNKIMRRSKAPIKALLGGDVLGGNERPHRTNPRYLILVELKRRVWKKTGWDADGKGIDPWGGLSVQWETGPCLEGLGPGTSAIQKAESATLETTSLNLEASGEPEWPPEEMTGNQDLDNILAGDPMNMFQWDEWESLAAEFFAS